LFAHSLAVKLDPLWTRVPFPYQRSFSVGQFATLKTVRMARRYFGRELLSVYCFVVGDTLVDTGLSCYGDAILELSARCGVTRAVLTHHHEVHAGNAATLRARGVAVLSSDKTRELVGRDLPIHFYQHLIWGKMAPAETDVFADSVRIGPYQAEVISAPGHCADQVVFFVRQEGWLFAGDIFLSERVKVFRRDEDFAATVDTLRRLLRLDFDALLCAHKPRFTQGRKALQAKLDWLLDIEGEVRRRHASGLPLREIERQCIKPPWLAAVLTAGDATAHNLVRAILFGPGARSARFLNA
jgi:glyoxylase-like metal-dependent hydrolase (beta-lactamase superfamily II)